MKQLSIYVIFTAILGYIAGACTVSIYQQLKAIQTPTNAHNCTRINCKMQGQTEFKSDCEEFTDCYLTDFTHYNAPQLTPEQVEDYIFGNPKQAQP